VNFIPEDLIDELVWARLREHGPEIPSAIPGHFEQHDNLPGIGVGQRLLRWFDCGTFRDVQVSAKWAGASRRITSFIVFSLAA
jgi:hypothetical protein